MIPKDSAVVEHDRPLADEACVDGLESGLVEGKQARWTSWGGSEGASPHQIRPRPWSAE